MNFKALRNLSMLGIASLTLVACGSKPKSIACDGLELYGSTFSFIADEEKIVIYDGELPSNENKEGYESIYADVKLKEYFEQSEITVKDSKVIINDNGEVVVGFLGKGPYELSLKTCPTEMTPAVQYFIPKKS